MNKADINIQVFCEFFIQTEIFLFKIKKHGNYNFNYGSAEISSML